MKKQVSWVIAAVVGAILGAGVASIVQGNENTSSSDACLAALEAADEGFSLAAEGMGYASDGFMSAANLDILGLELATNGMESVSKRLEPVGDTYRAESEECRELE